jgi:hypothetical protein
MALRSFPGGRTSEPAEFQCDVAPDFAGAGTGESVQRNDKAWSYSTTTVSPLVPADGGSASCAPALLLSYGACCVPTRSKLAGGKSGAAGVKR